MSIKSSGKNATAKQNQYISSTYDRVNLLIPKGQKDIIKAHVGQHSEYEGSVNRFINVAIAEQIKRDNDE